MYTKQRKYLYCWNSYGMFIVLQNVKHKLFMYVNSSRSSELHSGLLKQTSATQKSN